MATPLNGQHLIGRPDTGKMPVLLTDTFIPLTELAKLSASKPNVLRKHRVARWEAEGKAHKDPTGKWWVDPAVIGTIKAVKSRTILPMAPDHGQDARATEIRSASLESARSAGRARQAQVTRLTPEQVHALINPSLGLTPSLRVASAIASLAALDPVPWPLICKLAQMGKSLSKAHPTPLTARLAGCASPAAQRPSE